MNSLHEQLRDIQNLIKENEKLREKYPEHKKGLLISLTTLQQLEYEIIKKILDSDICANCGSVKNLRVAFKGDIKLCSCCDEDIAATLGELEDQGIMECIEGRWKNGDANFVKM